MSFWRGGCTCLEGLFGNQVGEKVALKIWAFLSSYGLVAPFAPSEHAKPSAPLSGQLLAGNKLTSEGLNVACWPLGYGC